MNELDAMERQVMIGILEWRTRYSYEYLKSLSDEKMMELYKVKVIDWETENTTKVKKK